jgi:phosphoglycerate dehydrogenase-like enzyme
MGDKVVAVLPGFGPGYDEKGFLRSYLEPRLPGWIDARWWASTDEMHTLAPAAEIGWFDLHYKPPQIEAVRLAAGLKWLNSLFAGLDFLDLAEMKRRGIQLTHGSGLTTGQVAEYILLGMLSFAKGFPEVVRAQDRREWLQSAPGTRDLAGSKALLIGYGAIGQQVARQLRSFGAEVVPVRRNPAQGALGADEWRARLGEFDWVVLTVPGTAQTEGMIGKAELAAMKREAVLVNFARGNVIDQDAVADAVEQGRIAGAVLDVATPEPLPPEHRLWSIPGIQITMHLGGRPTPQSLRRAADRFLDNCERYRKGEPLQPTLDPATGY